MDIPEIQRCATKWVSFPWSSFIFQLTGKKIRLDALLFTKSPPPSPNKRKKTKVHQKKKKNILKLNIEKFHPKT